MAIKMKTLYFMIMLAAGMFFPTDNFDKAYCVFDIHYGQSFAEFMEEAKMKVAFEEAKRASTAAMAAAMLKRRAEKKVKMLSKN